MAKYLKLFENHQEYESFTETEDFIKPNVSHCIEENHVHYNPIIDYAKTYLTFEALSDDTHLYFRSTRGGESRTISASTDNGKTWNEYTSSNSTNGTLIATLMKGQKVMIKGDIVTMETGRGYSRFNGLEGDGSLILYGNIMSLAYGDDFIGKTSMKKTVQEPIYEYDETTDTNVIVGYEDVEKTICFGWVFETILNLVSAENLILPADELYMSGTFGAYEGMFHNCTKLVKAPSILPATKLTNSCYYCMFEDCFSLQNTPKLPATTLAGGCYQYMFNGCRRLITAPELPATTLAGGCYSYMFKGCTSLTTSPELPATTLAEGCYDFMFQECTSLVNAPELPAMTMVERCYEYMFLNCTSLTTAPDLPATTLVENCYYGMFNGCTSLNYIKAMFTTTPSGTYTGNWVQNVASTGTFVKNDAATWDVTGVNGVPSGWSVETATE